MEDTQFNVDQRNTQGGGGAAQQHPFQIEIKKKKKPGYIDFVLFKAICELSFSFNQLLKLADDLYIRILKEKNLGCSLDEVKNTKIKQRGLCKACAS